MTVRHLDDRIEAYLDATLQPTTPDRATYVRVWTFTEAGPPTSRLLRLTRPLEPV